MDHSFACSKVKLRTKKLYRTKYRKIPKISPGAYIFQRPFLRGLYAKGPLSTEGNLGPGGGDSHIKQTGMLVVSLRGVNFGF